MDRFPVPSEVFYAFGKVVTVFAVKHFLSLFASQAMDSSHMRPYVTFLCRRKSTFFTDMFPNLLVDPFYVMSQGTLFCKRVSTLTTDMAPYPVVHISYVSI